MKTAITDGRRNYGDAVQGNVNLSCAPAPLTKLYIKFEGFCRKHAEAGNDVASNQRDKVGTQNQRVPTTGYTYRKKMLQYKLPRDTAMRIEAIGPAFGDAGIEVPGLLTKFSILTNMRL